MENAWVEQAPPAAAGARRIRFVWIADRRTDAFWYVGSAAAGWFYVGLILLLGRGMSDPAGEPLFHVALGGHVLPVTLTVIVVWSWAFLLDGPHLWATLARTVLDPDEWRLRGRPLRRSLGFFALGPAVVLLPYLLVAVGVPLSVGQLAAGYYTFFLFFQLWAYYHVVRQHWGFFRLYKRKAGDYDERREWVETWSFYALLYLPLAIFLASPWYGTSSGFFPDLGLRVPLLGGWSVADGLYPLGWLLYGATLVGYAAYTWARYRSGAAVSASKLLFLAGIVPLHLLVFVHPVLPAFLIPIITVGHNLQYHRIVWDYSRKKYFGGRGAAKKKERYAWARRAFSSVPLYGVVGILFTFACYRGPWVRWLQGTVGGALDRGPIAGALHAAGLQGGLAGTGIGESVFFAFLVGWALQHYYLDAKIWRVSQDAELRENLGMEG